MITKLAEWHFAGRLGQVRRSAMPAPCNDNYALGPKWMPRRVLVCHWQVQPLTGALECVWQTDMQQIEKVGGPAGAAADEAPALRRRGIARRR